MPDWTAARAAMMLDPTVTNLNTGSFGPLPRVVRDRVTQLRDHLAAEPMDFLLRQQPELLWQARVALAAYLSVTPERLLFTSNVSAAINLVASSLQLPPGGEILLTDHEYPAMVWCMERLARRLGLTLRSFALPTLAESTDEIVEALRRALSARTRLLFFSHVLSPTGLVLPARELCAEARRRGILTLVDGAHAPAFLALDVSAIGADFYAANAHKWLLAPTGSGFLHIGPGMEDRLVPFHVSWGWHNSAKQLDERDEYGSTPRLRRLEFEGTRDCCAWLTIPEAIRFQAELGPEAIRARMRELALHSRLCFRWLKPATPFSAERSGAMVAFELPAGIDSQKLRKALWEIRTEINVIDRPERVLFRTSTHFYNTHEELERLAERLPDLLARSQIG
ncbi:MAG: aminotransferase class V-fold PLP-dependent enzyme [Gemmataceae bacterium]